MAPPQLRHILDVLNERSIRVEHDDIAGSFDKSETAKDLIQWVDEYLSPHCLLTKEELHFVENNRSCVAKSDPSLADSQSVDDLDFEAAISSLEASTAAIERQCEVLDAQKKAIEHLRTRRGSSHGEDQTQFLQKRLAREKAQLDFNINELSESVRSRLQPQSKQSSAALSGLTSSIERALDKDDRLLDGLQKLVPKISTADVNHHDTTNIDELCQTLIELSGRDIRARIDLAYEEGKHAHLDNQINGHQDDSQVRKQYGSLRAELEELSSEIDGLLTMAVENQYRAPITSHLESARTEAEHDRARWGEYLLSTLHHLAIRLEVLEELCQHLNAHDSAIKHISAALDSVTAVTVDAKRDSIPNVRSPSTPTARGLKPLRLVQANLSEPQDPATQLLRQFDVRVSDASDVTKLAVLLDQVDRERRTHVSDLAGNTESSITDQLVKTTTKVETDVQHLLSAIYLHTDFGKVKLVNEGMQAAIDSLDDQTQGLGEEMRKLDVEEMGRTMKTRQTRLLA